MSTSTTSRRRRYSVRAGAATAVAALVLGAAACGTETASDGQPAAPSAPKAAVQAAPHTPMSADAAERWGASERLAAQQLQERYLRQLRRAAERSHGTKLRRSYMQAPSGREIPMP